MLRTLPLHVMEGFLDGLSSDPTFRAALRASLAVLVPRIYGSIMRLPMLVVLVATLIGALLMGIWGALVASQVAVAAQMLIRDSLGREPVPPG